MPFVEGGLAYVRGDSLMGGPDRNVGAVFRLVKSFSPTHYFAIDDFGNKFCVNTSHRDVTMRSSIGVEYARRPTLNKVRHRYKWYGIQTIADTYDIHRVEAVSRITKSHVQLMRDRSWADRSWASEPELMTAPTAEEVEVEVATPSPSSPSPSAPCPCDEACGYATPSPPPPACSSLPTPTVLGAVAVAQKAAVKKRRPSIQERYPPGPIPSPPPPACSPPACSSLPPSPPPPACSSLPTPTVLGAVAVAQKAAVKTKKAAIVKRKPATKMKKAAIVKKKPASRAVKKRPATIKMFRRPAAAAASIQDQVRYPVKKRIDWARKERDLQAILDRFGVQSKRELTPEQMDILVDEAYHADEYPLSDGDSDSVGTAGTS